MKKLFIAFGVLLVAIGLLMCFATGTFVNIITILIGFEAILNGFYSIFKMRNYFVSKRSQKIVLFRGILGILIGILAVLFPMSMAKGTWTFLLYIVAIYFVVAAILEISLIFQLKSAKMSISPFVIEVLLSFLIAIFFFALPNEIGATLIRVLGIAIILAGIIYIIFAIKSKEIRITIKEQN